jgi:hypothetical protein
MRHDRRVSINDWLRCGSRQTLANFRASPLERQCIDALLSQVSHKVTVLSFRKSLWEPNLVSDPTSGNEQKMLAREALGAEANPHVPCEVARRTLITR